jgi:1-acyl-sn-glycerol-3-phosphate acyltransferase
MKQFIIFAARILFRLISKTTITGLENVPTDRPAILTGNHIGILDGFILPTIPVLANHPNLIVIVAEKYEDRAFFRWVVKHLNFMFIDRFNPDVGTLKTIIRQVADNGLLVIAPEGTRSKTAQLIEGKSGTAYLAAKTGAFIIPFGCTGTEDSKMKAIFKKFKRLNIHINIGKPYQIPALPKHDRDDFLSKYTDEVMCRIAAQLPPSYRGVYADHPRLAELL